MFLPVNGDQYRNNVVLHLPMTGANNSTTFTDVSPSPKTITRYGDTKISTAQSRWGQGSGLFDGTGDYLATSSSSELDISSGNFTIEAYVRVADLTAQRGIYFLGDPASNANRIQFSVAADGSLQLYCEDGSATTGDLITSSAGAMSVNTWYHVAAAQSSTTIKLYVGGVEAGSGTRTKTVASRTVGYPGTARGGGVLRSMNGYLQDLRITKGVARYTANFAVPAGPLPARLPEYPVQRIQQPSFHQIARLGL